jgi:gliding motility-associated lipoprotein GldD
MILKLNSGQKYFPFFILLIFLFIGIVACNSNYTSKKKGYFKIDLPKHEYVAFDMPDFPYSFDYPAYARVIKDSTYFDSSPENPWWINIDIPELNARIFLSYKIIGGKAMYKIKQPDGSYKDSTGINEFDKMVNDAFNLTNKNQAISSSIKDSFFHTHNGITGVFFKVGGNAATAKQFFVSDTSKHFLRGALYFDATPNVDSLKPVQDFLQVDMDHLINSFRWKGN